MLQTSASEGETSGGYPKKEIGALSGFPRLGARMSAYKRLGCQVPDAYRPICRLATACAGIGVAYIFSCKNPLKFM